VKLLRNIPIAVVGYVDSAIGSVKAAIEHNQKRRMMTDQTKPVDIHAT
jgi:3-dehydroquinate synthetase